MQVPVTGNGSLAEVARDRRPSPGTSARIGFKRLDCSAVPREQTFGGVQEATIIAKRNQPLFDRDVHRHVIVIASGDVDSIRRPAQCVRPSRQRCC